MTAPRILAVAVDRSILQAVERALSLKNQFVHAATGASAAFSVLAHDRIDIVVIDIDRCDDPGLEPLEFIRLMRDRKPELDIIATAEGLSATMTADLMSAGAADCLDKAELSYQGGYIIDGIMERRRYRHECVPWPDGDFDNSTVIGRDPKFRKVYKQAARLARSNDPVLIVGERGTGKTAVAGQIHRLSRHGEPFVVLESTSIVSGIAESELFGHVKGAFTDANGDHAGYFERAGRGTVVIDEVADMPHSTQGKRDCNDEPLA